MSILCHLDFRTETNAVAACYETKVGKIAAVTQSVLGALHARTQGNAWLYVPFDTSKILACVARKQALLVVCHARILVEIVVIAC